jgi:hypothetical protein
MGSFDDLPTEILFRVLKLLNKNDFWRCNLTCKKLEAVASSLLYRDMSFRNKAQLESLLMTLARNPLLAALAETVTIEEYSWDYFHIFRLVKVCPNIKRINFYRHKIPSNFRVELLRQLRLGNWKKMNFIESPYNSSDFEPYVNAVWEIRDRLTEISFDLSRVAWLAGLLREHLSDRIELFGKLETLELRAYKERDMADFDIYINKCLLLRKLIIITSFMH